MATNPFRRRLKPTTDPYDEFGVADEPEMTLPDIGNRHSEGPVALANLRPGNPNPMLGGAPGGGWDFLTGAGPNTLTGPPGFVPITASIGPPAAPARRPPAAGGGQHGPMGVFSGGALGAGGGGGAGGQGGGGGFLGGGGGTGAAPGDVDAYLAGGADRLQTLQEWNPLTDGGYLRAIEAQAREAASRGGLVNPIRYEAEYRAMLRDPVRQRAYMLQSAGYDPQLRRMRRPAGFDPQADLGFLRWSQQQRATAAAAQAQVQDAFNPDPARVMQQRMAALAPFLGGQRS